MANSRNKNNLLSSAFQAQLIKAFTKALAEKSDDAAYLQIKKNQTVLIQLMTKAIESISHTAFWAHVAGFLTGRLGKPPTPTQTVERAKELFRIILQTLSDPVVTGADPSRLTHNEKDIIKETLKNLGVEISYAEVLALQLLLTVKAPKEIEEDVEVEKEHKEESVIERSRSSSSQLSYSDDDFRNLLRFALVEAVQKEQKDNPAYLDDETYTFFTENMVEIINTPGALHIFNFKQQAISVCLLNNQTPTLENITEYAITCFREAIKALGEKPQTNLTEKTDQILLALTNLGMLVSSENYLKTTPFVLMTAEAYTEYKNFLRKLEIFSDNGDVLSQDLLELFVELHVEIHRSEKEGLDWEESKAALLRYIEDEASKEDVAASLDDSISIPGIKVAVPAALLIPIINSKKEVIKKNVAIQELITELETESDYDPPIRPTLTPLRTEPGFIHTLGVLLKDSKASTALSKTLKNLVQTTPFPEKIRINRKNYGNDTSEWNNINHHLVPLIQATQMIATLTRLEREIADANDNTEDTNTLISDAFTTLERANHMFAHYKWGQGYVLRITETRTELEKQINALQTTISQFNTNHPTLAVKDKNPALISRSLATMIVLGLKDDKGEPLITDENEIRELVNTLAGQYAFTPAGIRKWADEQLSGTDYADVIKRTPAFQDDADNDRPQWIEELKKAAFIINPPLESVLPRAKQDTLGKMAKPSSLFFLKRGVQWVVGADKAREKYADLFAIEEVIALHEKIRQPMVLENTEKGLAEFKRIPEFIGQLKTLREQLNRIKARNDTEKHSIRDLNLHLNILIKNYVAISRCPPPTPPAGLLHYADKARFILTTDEKTELNLDSKTQQKHAGKDYIEFNEEDKKDQASLKKWEKLAANKEQLGITPKNELKISGEKRRAKVIIDGKEGDRITRVYPPIPHPNNTAIKETTVKKHGQTESWECQVFAFGGKASAHHIIKRFFEEKNLAWVNGGSLPAIPTRTELSEFLQSQKGYGLSSHDALVLVDQYFGKKQRLIDTPCWRDQYSMQEVAYQDKRGHIKKANIPSDAMFNEAARMLDFAKARAQDTGIYPIVIQQVANPALSIALDIIIRSTPELTSIVRLKPGLPLATEKQRLAATTPSVQIRAHLTDPKPAKNDYQFKKVVLQESGVGMRSHQSNRDISSSMIDQSTGRVEEAMKKHI